MSNGNRRPWYRDPKWLSVIVAIAAIVVTIIIWQYPREQPDFSISVDPMQGQVYQGGVIQTTITVAGTQYKHPVSLSPSGQPSGIVITFVPPFGEAKPSYTSTVTINVDSNVPVGIYEITIKGIGADGKEHSCKYTLNVMPRPVTPTPPIMPTPTPTPPEINIIDSMESTMGWYTYKDDKGSSINRKSIPGRTGNGIEISYDLKEWGWVTLNKRIDPSILSEIEGIRFFYKGTGKPNTIEFKLMYSDGDEYNGIDTTFGFLINAATVKDDWTQVEVPYDMLECWWSDKSCDDNPRLDLNKVRKIEFAISNKPEDGDLYGSGKVIIDDVQGIGPTTPEIRFTYPNDGDKFPLATGHTVEGTASNVPDDLSLWIVTVAPDNNWYPNTPVVIFKDTWSAKLWIGNREDVDEEFYIHAILADEKADTELQDYMDKSRREGFWPGLYSLPKGAKIYDKVKVIGIIE